MAQIKDLIVTGASRFLGNIYGTLKGNADTSTKATQDSAGQQINKTYIKGLSVSGRTITYTKGDGSTGTITTQDNNTTYGVATSSALGLVKSGTDITVDSSGNVSVNDDSHNHVISNIDGLQSALDAKAASSHSHSYLPLSGGTVTGATQFNNYLKLNAWSGYGTGTANFWYDANNKFVEIQNATDLKLAGTKVSKEGHTHNYAGSASAGGSANSAVKLDTATAGDSNTPVYFSGGKPVACTSLDLNTSGNAATASKVNNKLTVGSKSYDGSAAVTIEASDLGLASAMLFLGTTTTAITDGAKTNPVAIGGSNKTVTAGNVVLYGSKEFVWTGSAWEELGNEGSYKIVQAAVADPSASGTSNTFIATISQDTNGKITATKKTVAVTNSAPTLAWGATSTIGTVAGTKLQVKMPANPNTDTKVTQTAINAADYTNWRPLIWGSSNNGTEGFTPSTITDRVYTAQTLSCQPSSGTIRATTFKGNLSGNAATATKLATARTIRTNLASTSTASFNGSTNITPGVTGTLPIANGGTGATTASSARNNLGAQSKVLYGSSAPSDSTGSNGDMYIALESGDFKKDIVDLIYPVGSIYISMNSANPSTLFGGTWEAFGQGRVLIGAGTGNDGSTSLSFSASTTGGEYRHSLSIEELPSHNHGLESITGYDDMNFINGDGKFHIQNSDTTVGWNGAVYAQYYYGVTYNTGSGTSHNNIQPYIVTYMWKRVS